MPEIPRENADIKRYIAWYYLKKILITFLWDAGFGAVAWFTFSNGSASLPVPFVVLICLAGAAVPFWLAGWNKAIKAEHVCGTLVKKGFRYEIELPKGVIDRSDVSAFNAAVRDPDSERGADMKTDVVYFFIEDENGKIIRKRYYDDGEMTPLFFDGDTVCVRRELKYPYNVSAVHQGQNICAVCGRTLPADETVCPKCRHTIIRMPGRAVSQSDGEE